MANVFFASDTHFQHRLMEQHRSWDTIQEHDEALIKNWNDTVRPKDKVYHLGDFSMNARAIREVLPRLNGDKVLIKGNHDTAPAKTYLAHGFRDVRACWPLSGLILTHIPIHPQSLTRWGRNVHGHLHTNKVMTYSIDSHKQASLVPDPRYFCVSMEQIDYRPISLDEVREKMKC